MTSGPAPVGTGLTSRAALASVAVAVILVAAKGWAVRETGSSAMLASLADTSLDLAASVITLIGVRIAAIPADDDHRFGHGKAEAVVALVQVVLVSLAALVIGVRAVQSWATGAAPVAPESGIAISLFAIVLTSGLLSYQRHVIRRTGSVAIGADHLHYQSDLLLNAAVIAALALDIYAGLRGADAMFGVGIALWLIYGAWRMAGDVLDQLMDKEWPDARKLAFIEVALQHPEARGIHDLRTRTSGTRDFAQFRLWLRPDLTVGEADAIMARVAARLAEHFPGVEILIVPGPLAPDAAAPPALA